jgi:2-oxoglutarate dehydrogenase E1 component
MTPKSLLRNPAAASPLSDLVTGRFEPVLDDPAAAQRAEAVRRIVLSSGKVAIDLEASPSRKETASVAIIRVEQLAPFQHTAIRQAVERYPNADEIVWLQEEPQNMGAWTYMEPRLRGLLDREVRYIGRPERASPAEGAAQLHAMEQARIVAAAFVEPDKADPGPIDQATNGSNGSRKNQAGARRAAKSRS